ncbi:hypothetical protein M9H77_11722 [Catharanthus roseus]|uniref:Uncharacterized protein n=1 Tax=Catharanthus roseus TaxID=4058 RepID=A0ACC0BFG4_CATRO|nr:hypothetical protein M9H77_11722 [Catharanthus roseus]
MGILRQQPTVDSRSRPIVSGRLQGFLGTSDPRPTADSRSRPTIDSKGQHRVLDRRGIIHASDFPSLIPRAHAYFFGHTLVQKEGGFSEVHIVDIYLLDKLLRKSPLSLSSLIIHMMHNTGEQRLSTGPKQVIQFTTFNDYGYQWDKRRKEWIPPSEEDRLQDRSASGF